MRRTRFALFASLGFCLCFGGLLTGAASAQVSAVAPRISGPVDDSSLVTLKGSVSSLARSEFDRGAPSPSTEMQSVRIVLSRSTEQQAALDKLMAEQVDPSSANYRKWLTPEQFGRQFGPADSDIAAVIAWLQSRGLEVGAVPPGRNNIVFSGTVAQIEAAFHTSIHSFATADQEFLANISDPKIPAALAPVIAGIARLNTVQPRPHSIKGALGHFDPDSKRLEPAVSGPRPELTGSSGGLYVVAADAATIYNTPNSTLNAGFSSGTSYTGQGVTIGIGGESAIQLATVADYRTKFVGDSNQPTVTYCTSTTTPTCSTSTTGMGLSTDSGVIDEAYIDTELAGGLAPGAAIHYYASGDLFTAVQKAIDDNQVDIFSLSWGSCESSLGAANNSYVSQLWQQAATQGIVLTVSTGDNGSAGCDNNNTATTATTGLQVNGLASTLYNIAVGGTDYYPLVSSFSTYVSSTNGTLYRSALKYIPEDTWNESTTSNTTLASNAPALSSSNATNIVAGSGGRSSCATKTVSGCSAGYAKPSWQRGTGTQTDSVRDIPDVSLFASSGAHGAAWLVCTDDQNTAKTITANCTTQSDGHFYFMGFGGTSTAAPAFAGILAMVQQKAGGRIGLTAAKKLYDLYNSSYASVVFHDTVRGNISVPCTSGTPNCAQNTAGNYFLTGYDTGTGYDLATGLGSVDVTQLVNYWNSATGTASATVTAVPTPSNTTTNNSVSVAVTVSGGSGTPTGTVTISSGTYTSSSATLSSGAATVTIPANTFASGTVTLAISYSGDSTYAAASGSASIIYTAPPTATVTVTPASASIVSSQSLNVTVAVAGTAATPTGTVTLTSGTYTSSAATLTAGTATIAIPANSLAIGSDTITATYGGDTTYASKTGTATVTVTAPYSMKSTAPAAVTRGTATTSTITFTADSSYSGTVSLACALTTPTNLTDPPTCSVSPSSITITSGTASGTATVTINSTAAQAALQPHGLPVWTRAGGGAVLALFVFFGIPARRRSWRNLVGLLVLMVTLGSLSACGGGGGSSGGGTTPKDPGTSAGSYTFTVTGTGNPAVSPAPTVTVSATIN